MVFLVMPAFELSRELERISRALSAFSFFKSSKNTGKSYRLGSSKFVISLRSYKSEPIKYSSKERVAIESGNCVCKLRSKVDLPLQVPPAIP